MRAAHGGDLLTGHPGIDRTLAEVSRYWYWPTLARDVAIFVGVVGYVQGRRLVIIDAWVWMLTTRFRSILSVTGAWT